MIVGIATAQNRISPVFDCAGHITIYRIENGIPQIKQECDIQTASYIAKVTALNKLCVDKIICGAISREFHSMLIAGGIEVTPWISGNVEDILRAVCDNTIADKRFLMPGCSRNRCRCRRQSLKHNKNTI
ncbi:MAG: hypothetical protein RBU23_10070 [Candidatus Auribacterota bacterium]|jgi:predicted Fe-Mo cluster-binding NifX family protein|nr:hypothetical protein [Candidatus Auribacterota bacterium]